MDRAVCLYGPHRDDLGFNVNDMDAQTYGSQGQQRTTALSIKLAEIELMNIEVGEYPILLLDDVLVNLMILVRRIYSVQFNIKYKPS